MITRGTWPGWAPDMSLPPPMCHVHPAQRVPRPPRGGLVGGGAVVLTGLPSTPGGSSGYGYVGMDITDPGSWPRPFRPQLTTAWYCQPAEVK
jgi:hypothetical protein